MGDSLDVIPAEAERIYGNRTKRRWPHEAASLVGSDPGNSGLGMLLVR